MSDNKQPTGSSSASPTIGEAIDAWSAQTVEALKQSDGAGNARLAVPLLQGYLDTQLLQFKLEALFEELVAEQLVDPAKVGSRLIAKLERARRQAKASVEARPRVQPIGAAVAAAINGKKLS